MADQDAIEDIEKRFARYRENSILMVDGEPNRYSVVPFFAGTSFEDQGSGLTSKLFRSFEPIKRNSGRTMRGSAFDKYKDTLFDYPNIIGHMMQRSWQRYNFLISLHVAWCPYNCWYCYVDECLRLDCSDCRYLGEGYVCRHNRDRIKDNTFTAQTIFDEFLSERDEDRTKRNVLRVTGGEPFLVPELIHELLDLRDQAGLEDDIFLWTETNVVPFIKGKDSEKRLIESYTSCRIEDLAAYKNWALHPCLHGTSSENLKSQTGMDVDYSAVLEGLYHLVSIMGPNVYPTIASNLSPPQELSNVFKALHEEYRSLPLKVALIEDYLGYEPIQDRIKAEGYPSGSLFDAYTNVRIWSDLCKDTFGYEYAVVPREEVIPGERYSGVYPVAIEADENIEDVRAGDFIYIFKSCYRRLYKKELLTLLALPENQCYQLEYRDDLIEKTLLDQIPEGRHSRDKWKKPKRALLVYMDRETDGDERFVPLRFVDVCSPYRESGVTTLRLTMKDYVIGGDDFLKVLEQNLGSRNLPRSGVLGQKWVFTSVGITAQLQRNRQYGDVVRMLAGEDSDTCLTDWRESCFCKLDDIEMIKIGRWYWPFGQLIRKSGRKKPKVIVKTDHYEEYGYQLVNNCAYQIPLELLNPQYDDQITENNQLALQCDSVNIRAFTSTPVPVSKYHREELRFGVENALFRRNIGELKVGPAKDSFNYPSVSIQVRLVPDYWRLAAFLSLVLTGVMGLVWAISTHNLTTLQTFVISGISLVLISFSWLWYTGYLSGFTG